MKKKDYYDGDVSGDLTWADIPYVAPKFRVDCWEALERGERVPKSVVLLSDAPLTKEDLVWADKIIKSFKLNKTKK